MIQRVLPEVTKEDFCAAFDRRNILDSTRWDWKEALAVADNLRAEFEGRTVIVLGIEARKALGLYPIHGFGPQFVDGGTYYVIPHPSGRCRWYNEPKNCEVVGKFLAQFF
jgi:hypothetical protein